MLRDLRVAVLDEGPVAAAGALRGHLDLIGAGHSYNLYVKDRALVENSYELIAKHVIAATAD